MIDAVMPTYARFDVAFERGEGAYLFAADGRRFLDFASGIAVTGLGHCHPHLVEALQDQAARLWHCSNLYRIPGQERLAQRLVDNTFADSVFFNNSGAEAVECGLKMVRKYFDDAGQPERYRIIVCRDAFHGRTLATIAAGGQEKHLDGFDPVVDGFDRVAYGNLNETRAAITPETAAILVEPILGEGGYRSPPQGYLEGLRKIADEFDLLLFFDEVQCGMGRSGRLFAHQWTEIVPDIMAVAKALGGGFPIGACLATEKVATVLAPGSHGSTFGGNPLAVAAANAVLDVMLADGFLEGVEAVSGRLWRQLEAIVARHPRILGGVRGSGLMIGLECAVENKDLVGRLFDNGLLSVTAGDNVVRLAPPLIIDDSHAEEAVAVIESSCAGLEEGS